MAASTYRMYFSGANISIIFETSKQFPKFNIKQRNAGHKNLRPLCIELLQLTIYLLFQLQQQEIYYKVSPQYTDYSPD